MNAAAAADPRLNHVRCLDARGLHRMAYWEWGDAANPHVVVCVHGLTRQGRDFDVLARDLAADCRVVCPDIVGRGRSDRLSDPMAYVVPTYVADVVTLVARLGVDRIDWVGTSMGGLIGIALASLANTPVRRLVVNDVGPTLEPVAIERIGRYVGQPAWWRTLDEAADAMWATLSSFGPHSRDEWLALAQHQVVADDRDGEPGLQPHYDPAIALPFRAVTPAAAAAGEAAMWQAWDRIACPTLLLRGAESDLLSPATAAAMCERGPRAELATFAGVGHAPTLVAADQRSVVRRFLLDP